MRGGKTPRFSFEFFNHSPLRPEPDNFRIFCKIRDKLRNNELPDVDYDRVTTDYEFGVTFRSGDRTLDKPTCYLKTKGHLSSDAQLAKLGEIVAYAEGINEIIRREAIIEFKEKLPFLQPDKSWL